ncbi:MAG: hypothetical protein ACPLPX_08085 [Candidatus Kapaibacteriota bacterium]
MRTKQFFKFFIFAVTSSIFLSCQNMMNEHSPSEIVLSFLRIYPENDANNVPLNVSIEMEFALPVDTSILEEDFFLISQSELENQQCIDNFGGEHKDLHKASKNNMLINHIKEMHKIHGKFFWDSLHTKCEFLPERNLKPGTDYYVFLGPKMFEHMKKIMQSYDMMRAFMQMTNCSCCNRNNSNDESIIFHFKTGNNY